MTNIQKPAGERAIDHIRHESIESDRPQLSLAVFISHSDTDADPASITIPGASDAN